MVPKIGRLSLLFPVPSQQEKTEEYLTLRQLEFENLENPGSTLDERAPECHMNEPGPAPYSALLQ